MMRVCHLDTCPVGIATQNPEPVHDLLASLEFVVNFEFIAEEVRELMAQLGFRTIDEMIGRVEASTFGPQLTTGKHRASTFLQC